MDDRAWKRQKRRVESIWRRWRGVLGLESWDVLREYHDGPYVQGDGEASEYRHATIAFNLREVVDLPDDRLEDVVLHEAMHILLHEMREDGIKHEERVATTLAWAFMRTAGRRLEEL